MWFPKEYSQVFLPKLLTGTLTFLGTIITTILSLSEFLDLSCYIKPDPSSHIQENKTPATPTEPPLSAVLIRELLPAVRFWDMVGSTGCGGNGRSPECAVCLSEFEGEEEIRCLKNCQHLFHRGCIDGWMDCNRRSCPLCRKSLVPIDLQEVYNHRLRAAASSTDDDYDPDPYADDYILSSF